MKTSRSGIELIKKFEGFRSNAYKAVASEQYYTIGYGHYGSDVHAWDVITEQQAEELLAKDLERFENKVNQYTDKYNWTQSQFDACVSFSYNCGTGNFDKLVNYGNRTIDEIKDAWLKYNKSGGVVLRGLTTRRTTELELFNNNINNNFITDGIQVSKVTYDGSYQIVASGLRIRSGAGTNYAQVGSVKQGDIVDVTELITVNHELWGKIADCKYVCINYNNNIYATPYVRSNIIEYSLKVDGNKYITKNFKVKEFKCKDGSDKILIDTKLVMYLQLIRDYFDKPVIINSGYRTDSYNKKIGGASKSKHVLGMAADIRIEGIHPHEVCAVAERLGMLGIGEYTSFSHVDTRTSKSFWFGSQQLKRTTFIYS